MIQYIKILEHIARYGDDREGRNGMTRSLFAQQLRFDMREGFPAVTTKSLAFKAVKSELLWFLSGSGDDRDLQELNRTSRTIWTDNAEAPYWKPKARYEGDLGRVYGVQWRHWRRPSLDDLGDNHEVDQIERLVEGIRKDPYDRRHIVTAWNPGELEQMALPPCHMLFQCHCPNSNQISLHMVQRSCDMFLGVPFNIASYGLLLSMIGQVTQRQPLELVITLNDAHIYHAHMDQVNKQLARMPFKLPKLFLNPDCTELDQFKMKDIELQGYDSWPSIKAPMIV